MGGMPGPGSGSSWPDPRGGRPRMSGGGPGGSGRPGRGITVAACVALFVLGAAQGLLGAFFYAGPPPGLAAGFDALIFASCLFGGWGLSRPAGAFMPAAGWLLATFALANATSGGSVLIADSGAGKLYLFGGAIAAAAGAVTATLIWPGKVTAGRGRRAGHRRADGLAGPVAGEPSRFGGPAESQHDGQFPES